MTEMSQKLKNWNEYYLETLLNGKSSPETSLYRLELLIEYYDNNIKGTILDTLYKDRINFLRSYIPKFDKVIQERKEKKNPMF